MAIKYSFLIPFYYISFFKYIFEVIKYDAKIKVITQSAIRTLNILLLILILGKRLTILVENTTGKTVKNTKIHHPHIYNC